MLVTSNIINSAFRNQEDRLKCLCLCRENEKYISTLSGINCDIYIVAKDGVSGWKTTVSKFPDNIFALTKDISQLASNDFDFVMCHGRLHEFELAHSISQTLHIPLLTVDHVSSVIKQKLPMHSRIEADIQQFLYRVGDINISTSKEIKDSWSSSTYGISIEIPSYIEQHGSVEKTKSFVIDNNIPSQYAAQLEQILSGSECELRFTDKDELDISVFKFYINTWNNINNKTLEAMSLSCITFSPRTAETERVIEHGVNGILYDNIEDLKQLMLEATAGKYDEIAKASAQHILNNHSNREEYNKKWNQVLSFLSNSFFTRK
jgi:hypothetical protein